MAAVAGGIEFTLDIETTPEQYEDVIARLSTSNMIQKIYGTSGECRIHVFGLAPNSDTLGTEI